MSYILQALAKENKSTPLAKPNDEGSLSAGSNGAANIHHHVVPVVNQSNNHTLGWGILLTLAMLSSLLMGYWLGQESDSRAPAISTNVSHKQAISANESVADANHHLNEMLSENNGIVQANKKVLAAEQYFENPPAGNANINSRANSASTMNESSNDKNASSAISASVTPSLKDEDQTTDFSVKAVDGVSESLLARFQSAIENTNDGEVKGSSAARETDVEIRPLTDMPLWVQQGVPSLAFDTHIYASDGNGWVKVNGRDRYEQDEIAEHVILEEILPQQVVLSYQGEKFSLAALTNWQ